MNQTVPGPDPLVLMQTKEDGEKNCHDQIQEMKKGIEMNEEDTCGSKKDNKCIIVPGINILTAVDSEEKEEKDKEAEQVELKDEEQKNTEATNSPVRIPQSRKQIL